MPVTDQWPIFSRRGRGSVWIFVAMLVGLVLAVVLMPRPDTGPELTPLQPSSSQSMEAPAGDREAQNEPDAAPQAVSSTAEMLKPQIRPPGLDRNRDPMEQRNERNERLKEPIPVAVGRVMGPWTQVRRLLNTHTDDPFSMQLAERTQNLLLELRQLRRDPVDSNWSEIHASQRELLELLQQTPAHDDEMQKMTARIQEVLATVPPQP